jgi:hypothetical protein
MDAVLKYRGREVSAKDVEFIGALIAANPQASRWRLSKKLCEAWGWIQPNGFLKDMICRGLMLELHRAGHIELPPVKIKIRNPFVYRKKPAPVTVDRSAVRCSMKELGPPIQMCDMLSHNTAGDFETILAGCMVHSRRKYVEVANAFPDKVKHVLQELKEVYIFDDLTKKQNMTDEQRLVFHQQNSGPVMIKLKEWLDEQFKKKKVEPNSSLGEAIKFMTKHWDKLTLFLRVPGAPLDNNIVERALKKAIRHRRNSLFYKTKNGARVGDMFMSFIHTAELNGANSFDYLETLLRYSDQVSKKPADWMPWNYKQALKHLKETPPPQ